MSLKNPCQIDIQTISNKKIIYLDKSLQKIAKLNVYTQVPNQYQFTRDSKQLVSKQLTSACSAHAIFIPYFFLKQDDMNWNYAYCYSLMYYVHKILKDEEQVGILIPEGEEQVDIGQMTAFCDGLISNNLSTGNPISQFANLLVKTKHENMENMAYTILAAPEYIAFIIKSNEIYFFDSHTGIFIQVTDDTDKLINFLNIKFNTQLLEYQKYAPKLSIETMPIEYVQQNLNTKLNITKDQLEQIS